MASEWIRRDKPLTEQFIEGDSGIESDDDSNNNYKQGETGGFSIKYYWSVNDERLEFAELTIPHEEFAAILGE